MKLFLSNIDTLVDTTQGATEIIVENQQLLLELLIDIDNQLEGKSGQTFLSHDSKELPIAKNLELLSKFENFSVSKKTLVNKLCVRLEKIAINEQYYEETMHLLQAITILFDKISNDTSGSIRCSDINIGQLIKTVSPSFDDADGSICERLLDYFELVREYECEKVFVLYNVRSVIDDVELTSFVESANRYNYKLIIVESLERDVIVNTNRIIVDHDKCVIR